MNKFKVVIPARYGSTRLLAKPLSDICGKPMVIRVVESAIKSGADEVIVATDNLEIMDVVHQYGFKAIMTDEQHPTGTDRIAQVVELLGWHDDDIIVNVQGDEPLISPVVIKDTANNLAEHPEASIATACHIIKDNISFFSPNTVKVVMDKNGHALYFSRATIPYPRNVTTSIGYSHVGIYAYTAKFLKQYNTLEKCELEYSESLEQLRTLYNGHKISVFVSSEQASIGVDTEDDLELVRTIFEKRAYESIYKQI